MVKIIIYTVCFLAIVGISLYGINKLYQYGWTGGFATSESAWKSKATEALGKKINNINKLNEVITQRAQSYKDAVEGLERTYTEELEYVELGKDMAIAAVLDGVVKLYDPFNPERVGRESHCEGAGETTSVTVCTPVGNDSQRGELHPKTSAFLFGETLRADLYTEQLGKCQESIVILQKACGAKDANSTN